MDSVDCNFPACGVPSLRPTGCRGASQYASDQRLRLPPFEQKCAKGGKHRQWKNRESYAVGRGVVFFVAMAIVAGARCSWRTLTWASIWIAPVVFVDCTITWARPL